MPRKRDNLVYYICTMVLSIKLEIVGSTWTFHYISSSSLLSYFIGDLYRVQQKKIISFYLHFSISKRWIESTLIVTFKISIKKYQYCDFKIMIIKKYYQDLNYALIFISLKKTPYLLETYLHPTSMEYPIFHFFYRNENF